MEFIRKARKGIPLPQGIGMNSKVCKWMMDHEKKTHLLRRENTFWKFGDFQKHMEKRSIGDSRGSIILWFFTFKTGVGKGKPHSGKQKNPTHLKH